MKGELSAATAKAVAAQVAVHRSMLGVDSMAMINRSELAELADAHHYLVTALAEMTTKAEKHERREMQFMNWWTGVKKQLDDHMRKEHYERDAPESGGTVA